MPKIEGKHLVFKASVAGMKTRLLIDNGSEAELIDESFVRTQRIDTFKLKKRIKLTLGNGEVVQKLDSACLVDVHIGDHHEQILCYVANLDVYSMVLEDGWLQIHNPAINWKERTMKFNSAACMESGCLPRGNHTATSKTLRRRYRSFIELTHRSRGHRASWSHRTDQKIDRLMSRMLTNGLFRGSVDDLFLGGG